MVLAQNVIKVSYTTTAITGTATVSPRLYWKQNSGDPWTAGTAGEASQFATNFRYVRVVLTITGASNLALLRVSGVTATIETKKQTDAGEGTITNATNGLVVNFVLDFVDVLSINVTPMTTSARFAVVDFNDVPNPTSFTVFLYDTSGTKQTGNIRWTATGVISA